jgi:hypothetical protein
LPSAPGEVGTCHRLFPPLVRKRRDALHDLEHDGSGWISRTHHALWNRDHPCALGFTTLGDEAGSDGYISSAASRTIWVQLYAARFHELFNTTLRHGRLLGVVVRHDQVIEVAFAAAQRVFPAPAVGAGLTIAGLKAARRDHEGDRGAGS